MNRQDAVSAYIILTKLVISRNLPMSYTYDKKLSNSQLHALVKLEECGDMPLSQLAQKSAVSNQSMTAIADKLEKLGYVQRQHSRENRRSTVLHLTETGRQYMERFYRTMRGIFEKDLAQFSDEEMEALGRASLFLAQMQSRIGNEYGSAYQNELRMLEKMCAEE